jgi:carboxylate-amine ligase
MGMGAPLPARAGTRSVRQAIDERSNPLNLLAETRTATVSRVPSRPRPGRAPAALPPWAEWSPAAVRRPWTVGLEEEVLLVEPRTWALTNRADEVRRMLPPHLAVATSSETHACVLELCTAPHETAVDAGRDLARLRGEIAAALRALGGVRATVTGTHPSASWQEVAVSPGARYRFINASLRELSRREPTCALHVHVAVPGADAAMRAYQGLRADQRRLHALSANCPLWQGRYTGLASARTPIFGMFPRAGVPRSFTSFGAYVGAVESLMRCGAIPDPSFLWWDIRLRPSLGTVELRVMDAQTRVEDAAALAALVQCRVRCHCAGESPPSLAPELLAESRFLAARDGMCARLIDPATGRMRPAPTQLVEMLAESGAAAAQLRCSEDLDAVARLALEPAYARQRRVAAARGLPALLRSLSDRFEATPVPSAV